MQDRKGPAPPDGDTLMLGTTSSHSIAPAVRPNFMPYGPVADFTPIGVATKSANIIVVHPSIPAKTLPELIAYSKTVPKPMGFASSPPGSTNHLAGEMLRLKGANIPRRALQQHRPGNHRRRGWPCAHPDLHRRPAALTLRPVARARYLLDHRWLRCPSCVREVLDFSIVQRSLQGRCSPCPARPWVGVQGRKRRNTSRRRRS